MSEVVDLPRVRSGQRLRFGVHAGAWTWWCWTGGAFSGGGRGASWRGVPMSIQRL